MTLMTLYDLFFTIMPTFSPAPTLVETDVSSSSLGTVSLTLLPLISISILIPVILFFTYRLFKRAPTLPIRLPLPSAWSQWLQGRALKGQSTKSRLPPAKLPKFIQKLSGSSSPVELLPTAIKGIPSPAPSPYAYQVAFHSPSTPPTIPARTTATPVPSGNLLSRSPSVADPDDYILSPTKPLEWDLTRFKPPTAPIARPTSAPPQARTPSPKPRWSPIKERIRIPVTEQVPRTKSTTFKLNITSLFTSAKPFPLTRSTSSSPYGLLRSKASSPPSPTSSLAPLIDFSPAPPVSSITGLPTPSPEEDEIHAQVHYLRVPEPVPIVFKLVDAPTPERPASRLADAYFGSRAIQSTPTRAPKRASVDEPLVRLNDSADDFDDEDDLDTIQLKPITPMKKFTSKAPSPIALPPLPLSRSTSGGYNSSLLDLESPIASPSLAREVEARTERILVELDIDRDDKVQATSMAGGAVTYPFPMPLTPPPTAPNMNWAMESPNGEVWGWGGSSVDAIHDDDENPFVVRPKEISQPSSPLATTDSVEDPLADPITEVYDDPFADPADVTFVEEVPAPMAVVDKVEVEPLALLAVAKNIVEQKYQESSSWEECHTADVDEVKEPEVELTTDEWMNEEEKTMVAAEVSQLLADELEEEDAEVEVAVVLTEEESDEPVEVVECIVKAVEVEEDAEEVVDEEKDVEVPPSAAYPTPLESLDLASVNDAEEEFPSPSISTAPLEPSEVVAEPEESGPISITLEREEESVEEFPDPDFLPLPALVAPTPIVIPQPIIYTPDALLEAKSPLRETPLQTPTPPASPPPSLSRTTSRGRSRLATPEFSPRPKLVVELPVIEKSYSGSITVVPPSALPAGDCSAEVTPISPLSPISAPTLDAQLPEPVVNPASSEDDAEDSVEELEESATPALENEGVLEPETEKPTEEIDDATDDEDDMISSPIPGSFPPASIPAPVDPPPKEKNVNPTPIRPSVPSLPFGIQKPQLAIDIALAMQLRPGLGHGSDPAWMVRFLMSVFGWFVVTVSGNIQ